MTGKNNSMLLSAIFIFETLFSFGQPASPIIGKWKSEDKDKNMQLEIYPAKDANYYGKVINDTSTPSKNGHLIIQKLSYNTGSRNYKGTMEPPDMNVILNVTVSVESVNRLKIVAKKLFMSKTIYLSRLQ